MSSNKSQDTLPFPPTPSASIAGRTMQESRHQRRVEPRRLPDDAPNILRTTATARPPGGSGTTPLLKRLRRQAHLRVGRQAWASDTSMAS